MKKARSFRVTPAGARLPGDASDAVANAALRLPASPSIHRAGRVSKGASWKLAASSAPTIACLAPEIEMECARAAPDRLVLIRATCAPTLNRPSQAQM